MRILFRAQVLVNTLVVISLLPFVNVSDVRCQSGSNRLDESKWLGNTIFHPTGEMFGNYFYVFRKDGKVEFHLVVMIFGESPLQPLTDALRHDNRLITDPFYLRHNYLKHVDHFSEVGTYEQKGPILRMKFSAHEIDARITDKEMTGTLKFTGLEKRTEDWKATKLPTEADILSADVNIGAKFLKHGP